MRLVEEVDSSPVTQATRVLALGAGCGDGGASGDPRKGPRWWRAALQDDGR